MATFIQVLGDTVPAITDVLSPRSVSSEILTHRFDRNALRSYVGVVRKGQKGQLQDITDVVGSCSSCNKKKTKSLSKKNFNQRDRDDFYTPSTPLFNDFCQDMVSRYDIDQLVCPASVKDVDVIKGEDGSKLFSITYHEGMCESKDQKGKKIGTCAPSEENRTRTIRAKRVVMATGNSTQIRIPEWALMQRTVQPSRLQHASEVSWDAQSLDRIGVPAAGSRLLVVGGGLTSAQLVNLGVKYGVEKVCFHY